MYAETELWPPPLDAFFLFVCPMTPVAQPTYTQHVQLPSYSTVPKMCLNRFLLALWWQWYLFTIQYPMFGSTLPLKTQVVAK